MNRNHSQSTPSLHLWTDGQTDDPISMVSFEYVRRQKQVLAMFRLRLWQINGPKQDSGVLITAVTTLAESTKQNMDIHCHANLK